MKRSIVTSFLHRVRIHGGEFDASARAMHRKAAFENVSGATIERKLMSTKTTFKRVALVAVAALGIGMLSAVPSNAVQPNLYILTADGIVATGDSSTVTAGGVAGVANTVKVNATEDAAKGGLVTVTGPTGSIITAATIGGTVATGGASATLAVGSTTSTLTIATPAVGTITVSRYLETTAGSGVYSTTASDSVTITVAATAVAGTFAASTSTAVISKGTSYAPATAGVDDTVAVAKGTTQVASIKLTLKNSSGGAYVGTGTDVTATITGPGLIAYSAGGTALGTSKVATMTLTSGVAYIVVSGDGTAGVGSIAISVNGVLFSTKTVTFSGSAASYAVVPAYSMNTIPTGAATANALDVVAYDANGNIVTGQSLTMTSSNTAVIASGTVTSSPTATAGSISLTALSAVGTTTLTFSDASSTITSTTSITIKVSSGTISTSVPSLSFDKTSYAPGEKMVLTLSAVDASGLPVPNTVTAASLLTSAVLSSNTSLQGFPTSFTGTLTDGSISYTVYAPLIAGDVTVTGTGANTAATALTATATVSGGDSAAAVDAANAATDAANYAADAADAATTAAQEATAAAQAAQDSADAATAAVVALGLRVNVLMASVRAQLTSLSNLLVRIIKKTKA